MFYIKTNTKKVIFVVFTCLSLFSSAQSWEYVINSSTGLNVINRSAYSLAFSPSGVPILAYSEQLNSTLSGISVRSLNGNNWSLVSTFADQNYRVGASELVISPSGNPVIGGNNVISFNGINWSVIGGNLNAPYFNMSFDPLGRLTCLGNDDDAPDIIFYNGTTWVTMVGSRINRNEYPTAVTTSPQGNMVGAFEQNNSMIVRSFSGSNWTTVGGVSLNIENTQRTTTDIGFNKAGNLYYASEDRNAQSKATIMKFDGSSWSAVGGGAGITPQAVANALSLAISPAGNPVIAYAYRNNSNYIIEHLSVMSFDGSNWQTIGNNIHTTTNCGIDGVSLKINQNTGELYVGYRADYANGANYTSANSNTTGCGYYLHMQRFAGGGGLNTNTLAAKNDLESQITIFPNPNSGSFVVELPSLQHISIYNILGQKIFDSTTAKKTHSVSGLNKGVYTLKSGNYMSKIVVE